VPFHVHGIYASKIFKFIFLIPKNSHPITMGDQIFYKIFQIKFGMIKVNKFIYEILVSNIDMV
jgi:hypothetical protein